MKSYFVIILITISLLLSLECIDAGRGGGRRSGSSSRRGSFSSKSQTPSPSRTHGGSNPGTIGWNVPQKQPASVNKPSVHDSEKISKTSATNVQSGYQPSGGYGHNTGGAFGQQAGHNPSSGHVPSAPYPSGGVHNNPSAPHYGGTPVGHQPNGYGMPGGAPPSYGSVVGGHPPSYGTAMGGHPPSYGAAMGGHPPPYGGHIPNQQSYNPNTYNPSYGHSYTPGAGYNPPVGGFSQPQTIFVQSGQSSRPGIGQLAKEAFVFAGVSAGVNAVVNRVLPGGIHNIPSQSYGGAPVAPVGAVPGSTHTEITYNNYYMNGTSAAGAAAPNSNSNQTAAVGGGGVGGVGGEGATAATAAVAAAVAPQSAGAMTPSKPVEEEWKFVSPMGRYTYKHEMEQLSEELLSKDVNNAFKYITMKLQGQKTDGSITDDAPDHLLTVSDAAWEIPTIKAVLALYDNYELDSKVKEVLTDQEREEENALINAIVDTEVMKRTMNFLVEKGYISDDTYEFKNALKRIWFTRFQRSEHDASSSGFETVFLAENFDSAIIGLHNWIYYAKKEVDNQLNYLGYIKHTSLEDKGAVLKVRSTLNGTLQDVTTLFIGTSPELDMSLYTLCFYISPNSACPIKLARNDFIISALRAISFDKDILISAFPDWWTPPPVQSFVNANQNVDNTNVQQSTSDMTDRRLNIEGNLKSSSQSQFYSTLLFTKFNCLFLLILIKFF